MTQNCPKCGEEIPKPVNVCSNCGKKLRNDRPERTNPSRVEGCLSTLLFIIVNAVVITAFLSGLL